MAGGFARVGIPGMTDLNVNISDQKFTMSYHGFGIRFERVAGCHVAHVDNVNPTPFESEHAAVETAKEYGLELEFVTVEPV